MSIVETTAGQVEGTTDGGLEVFRGIPYASPPVGELRFRAPQPHPGWTGVREATEFGAVARQHPNEALRPECWAVLPQAQSEDCLFLNIWTPGLDRRGASGDGLDSRRRVDDRVG